jgi:hypothetical protein
MPDTFRCDPASGLCYAQARAAGLRLAIATTTSPENVSALLRASLAPDAEAWFEVIGAGDVVPAQEAGTRHLSLGAGAPRPAGRRLPGFRGFGQWPQGGAGRRPDDRGHGRRIHADHDFSGACAVLSDLGVPERPALVRLGDMQGKPCVDVDLLRRWHGQDHQ